MVPDLWQIPTYGLPILPLAEFDFLLEHPKLVCKTKSGVFFIGVRLCQCAGVITYTHVGAI